MNGTYIVWLWFNGLSACLSHFAGLAKVCNCSKSRESCFEMECIAPHCNVNSKQGDIRSNRYLPTLGWLTLTCGGRHECGDQHGGQGRGGCQAHDDAQCWLSRGAGQVSRHWLVSLSRWWCESRAGCGGTGQSWLLHWPPEPEVCIDLPEPEEGRVPSDKYIQNTKPRKWRWCL